MKIVIANSPLHFTHGHTFTQADWQTLILPALAGIIGPGHDIHLIDNTELFWRSNRTLDACQAIRPDVVAFSVIANRDINSSAAVVRAVRAALPDAVLLAGGQGATSYAELFHDAGIDVVVHGEGERTLPELLAALERHDNDLSAIDGISFRRAGAIVTTRPRANIDNLDDSPLPAWHLMPKRKSLWFPGRLVGSLETSRGCPHKCAFCAIVAYWGNSFRQKSNDRIIEEMKHLKAMGRTHLYLADDAFGIGTAKHVDLFERMLSEGLDVKFFSQIRADTVAKNPEMMALAARAGMYGGLIGFDSYDEADFRYVSKRATISLNLEAAQVMRANGIAIFGTHIYGLPTHKTPLDFKRTFFLGRRNSDLFRMPFYTPYAGTNLYKRLEGENGIVEESATEKEFTLRATVGRQRLMRFGYYFYNILHNLLPDEMAMALFHPNPAVRTFKRRGYAGVLRHYFYRFARHFVGSLP